MPLLSVANTTACGIFPCATASASCCAKEDMLGRDLASLCYGQITMLMLQKQTGERGKRTLNEEFSIWTCSSCVLMLSPTMFIAACGSVAAFHCLLTLATFFFSRRRLNIPQSTRSVALCELVGGRNYVHSEPGKFEMRGTHFNGYISTALGDVVQEGVIRVNRTYPFPLTLASTDFWWHSKVEVL